MSVYIAETYEHILRAPLPIHFIAARACLSAPDRRLLATSKLISRLSPGLGAPRPSAVLLQCHGWTRQEPLL